MASIGTGYQWIRNSELNFWNIFQQLGGLVYESIHFWRYLSYILLAH